MEGSGGATRKRRATRSGRGAAKGVESLATLEGPPFEGRARPASAPSARGSLPGRPPASLVPTARRRNSARAAVFPGPRA